MKHSPVIVELKYKIKIKIFCYCFIFFIVLSKGKIILWAEAEHELLLTLPLPPPATQLNTYSYSPISHWNQCLKFCLFLGMSYCATSQVKFTTLRTDALTMLDKLDNQTFLGWRRAWSKLRLGWEYWLLEN